MKNFEYSEAENDILEAIIGLTAKKVIYNFMYYILDFGDYHVLFHMELENGISKTGGQEIKYTKPEVISARIELEESDKVIAENLLIDKINILRTILYWEKVENESVPISVGSEETNKKIADIIGTAFETEMEMMIKPALLNESPIDIVFANLADVGVQIESNKRSLVIGPINNCFGFMEYQEGFFWSEVDIEEHLAESFDFLEVKKKN